MDEQSLTIEATQRSPRVVFDPATGHLTMSGESYPEDASRFFGPILTRVKDFLAEKQRPQMVVDIGMIYFNSSSAKAIMNLFQLLEEAAEDSIDVTVNWYFDPDDDMMEEMGEDFAADFEAVTFNLKPEPLNG